MHRDSLAPIPRGLSSSALGVKSGLPRERFLEVLGETAAVSPSQRSKLENARKNEYPSMFALRLMLKDFGLILEAALEQSVPMPATAAATQVAAAEHARQLTAHGDEDFSVVVRTMERLAGVAE
jgi:3-hydroxyisobutyrate dehydrogenase